MSDDSEVQATVQIMAGIASAMAAEAHHSTQAIEGYLSSRLVELYDGVKHVHARLGVAMQTGNMFKMVSAYEDLSELLALSSIGMDRTRENSWGNS